MSDSSGETAPPAARREASDGIISDEVRSINVLHVDDEPDFAEMAAEFIHRQDDRFDIETVTSASEDLDRPMEYSFDCIVVLTRTDRYRSLMLSG